jgi:GH25 family lysozyme M1 (1,4-beta-N-acetylmuramidase)
MSVSRVPGIDVSRWQRRIDWSVVADAGYRFAFIRATIGDEYTDPRFYLNWDGARETEMLLAPYHVLRPDVPPDDQIDSWSKPSANAPATCRRYSTSSGTTGCILTRSQRA